MAGKIFDNIVNMIEKRTKEKISPIQNEKIQNISISQKPDSGYARGDLIPVNFYVDIISLNDSINAKINFNIAQTDENGNPVKVLIYKIYRDTENEEGERAGFPELIAEISSSLITSGVFSFNDNGFPMGNVVYYTITCVDTTGFESPFGEWQRYEDSYPEINNLQLKDFEILEDKSVKINFDIELLRNYSHGFEEIGKEIETNNFLELLDFVQVREGNLLIDQFEELSYRFYPDKFSTTLNFRPRTKRGTVSSESLELKIGGTSPDISFDIGSLNAGSCSAEEDVYVNADGSSVSRIKLSLIAGSVVPSEVLIKARRKAISPNPQEAYFVVYDGIYEPELIIEQGASTGWNKIQIGVYYQIQVFVKTSWGLIKDSPDYEEELKIEGSTESPTPVFFVDGNGNQIETLTTPKYFELDWGESVDFDDDLYVIKISKPEISTWENADHLYTGRATKFVYTPTPEQFASYNTNGTIRFWIKSFNARGTEQDIAKKIDITNNAPSKPNTPTAEFKRSGVTVSWTEKTTNDDKDISHYIIFISENEGAYSSGSKVEGNTFSLNPNPGSTYKFKIKAVDIYNQESVFSDESTLDKANLSSTAYEVIIYPSGNSTSDTTAFNEAFSYLDSLNGGIIKLAPSEYHLDLSSLSCSSSKRINIVCEFGVANINLTNLTISSSVFSTGGNVSNLYFKFSSSILRFNAVSAKEVKNVSFQYREKANIYANFIENCDGARYCSSKTIRNSRFSFGWFEMIENCTIENNTGSQVTIESRNIFRAKFLGGNFAIRMFNNEEGETVSFSEMDFSGVNTGNIIISQHLNGFISGKIVVSDFNLTIYQGWGGIIKDLVLELRSNNTVQVFQEKRFQSVGAPPLEYGFYATGFKNGIHNSKFTKLSSGTISVFQGYDNTSDTDNTGIWWLSNSYIAGNVTTRLRTVNAGSDRQWSENVITGTVTHLTF